MDHIFDTSALKLAHSNGHSKAAFVPAGDPGMQNLDQSGGGGGGAPPPGGDPSGGAAAMAQGGPMPQDPSAGGGAPPGGGAAINSVMPLIQGMQQQQQATGNKPKIDEKVVLVQILHILAMIADHLDIKIPAQMMVATPQAMDAIASQGGAQGQPQQSPMQQAFPPISPMLDQGGGGAGGGAATKSSNWRETGQAFQALSGQASLLERVNAVKERRSRET